MKIAQNFDREFSAKESIWRLKGNIETGVREITFEDVNCTEMAKNQVRRK
jgi:hypothetical protein